MLRGIGKQSGESVESVLKKKRKATVRSPLNYRVGQKLHHIVRHYHIPLRTFRTDESISVKFSPSFRERDSLYVTTMPKYAY